MSHPFSIFFPSIEINQPCTTETLPLKGSERVDSRYLYSESGPLLLPRSCWCLAHGWPCSKGLTWDILLPPEGNICKPSAMNIFKCFSFGANLYLQSFIYHVYSILSHLASIVYIYLMSNLILLFNHSSYPYHMSFSNYRYANTWMYQCITYIYAYISYTDIYG